ncbi:organic solvent tolerance ABC transporter, periplasmic substrate-binding protein [Syntrophotalea carbinolica DSM 2380]|uniref:Organic solvent tolerance ABC transporter, periplasmic substrate-binding protein n=1 Tax=Syntrophotalea carbinolica (strain DSM 2380 / NBRC 103641 / GraBd1) TaxID=338963 RepID=Q3A7D3_SYNC1|nr:ABC transporter substrate-binding protein [Syntrophotalea carbinolica]ABA87711.1 organic solvent tolerance ABC transporter, periplasmic substrate-binding protein [Syntrophotalea carbinolica DSM 2380]
MKIRYFLLCILMLAVFGWMTPAMAVPGPTEQLRVTLDKIIEVLRNKELPQDAILDQVETLVRSKFDFNAMSQRTLGVNWRNATPEQRRRFVDLFSQLLEDTYRSRIRNYTYQDEHVEYVGEEVRGTRGQVDTLVVANKEIPVSYRVRLKGDQWLVYDVIVEEVSLVSNYRSSYNEIIRQEGFDGLLVRLEDKIRELEAAQSADSEPGGKAGA